MKYIIILFLIVACNHSFASKKKVMQLNYEQYIEKYGTDETSIIIIDLFFNKRNLSGIGQMSFLPVTSSVAVIVPPIGLVTMAISTPLFLNGILVRHKYSHKNLLIALEYYQNNKLLSKRFKRVISNSIKNKRSNSLKLKQEEKLYTLKKINISKTILVVR